MTPPLLIIKTGSTMPALKECCGDFEDWMLEELDWPSSEALVVDVSLGEALPEYYAICGIVITGSHAMVSDRQPWSETTAAWLKVAAEKQIPTLGICYGHQLLAHALGGRVEYNPKGREVGTIAIDLLPDAAQDPLLHDLPSPLEVQLSHRQAVIDLPDNVVHLARSGMAEHQAFRYGETVWGLQFHPEFSPRVTQAYANYARDGLIDEGFDPDRILETITPTPNGPTIMRRFAGLMR
jgi:GMP synthase (glutamine-hydrolysing)